MILTVKSNGWYNLLPIQGSNELDFLGLPTPNTLFSWKWYERVTLSSWCPTDPPENNHDNSRTTKVWFVSESWQPVMREFPRIGLPGYPQSSKVWPFVYWNRLKPMVTWGTPVLETAKWVLTILWPLSRNGWINRNAREALRLLAFKWEFKRWKHIFFTWFKQ